MRVIVGDLWSASKDGHFIIVPINWTYNRNGNAVMGRGVAAQAAKFYPDLPGILGRYIMSQPTMPEVTFHKDLILVPVKRHWKDTASITFIDKSLRELTEAKTCVPHEEWYLPLLGAGFGDLEPLTSLTLMASILTSDNYTLVLKDTTVVSKYSETFKPSVLANRKDKTI